MRSQQERPDLIAASTIEWYPNSKLPLFRCTLDWMHDTSIMRDQEASYLSSGSLVYLKLFAIEIVLIQVGNVWPSSESHPVNR